MLRPRALRSTAMPTAQSVSRGCATTQPGTLPRLHLSHLTRQARGVTLCCKASATPGALPGVEFPGVFPNLHSVLTDCFLRTDPRHPPVNQWVYGTPKKRWHAGETSSRVPLPGSKIRIASRAAGKNGNCFPLEFYGISIYLPARRIPGVRNPPPSPPATSPSSNRGTLRRRLIGLCTLNGRKKHEGRVMG